MYTAAVKGQPHCMLVGLYPHLKLGLQSNYSPSASRTLLDV